MTQEIGRVIGTEKRPNTAYTFFFWTPKETKIGIGSLVKVISEDETVYGTVVEAQGFNDLESPLHEFLSVGGDATMEPPTLRPEMRVFQAAVLRRDPEEPVGAVPIGRVFLADEADVQRALRTERYVEAHGIPCGCYGAKEAPVAVHLHSQYLLGPEAGHLNITGTSGLASKTSFILFLLRSILQHYKDDPRNLGEQGVCALLFNTKGGDLLYIDQEPDLTDSDACLTDLDKALYASAKVEPKPFENVRYFAPYDRDGVTMNTLRLNDELDSVNPTQPVSFGLKDVVKHAEVLLNKDDLDAKADAYLQYLSRRFIEDQEGHQIGNEGPRFRAKSLQQLIDVMDRQIQWCDRNVKDQVDTHHVRTIHKMRNRINGLGLRFAGLIAEGGEPEGPFTEGFRFESGTVYVVDVSRLTSEAQDLVFAAAITRLREQMEEQRLGVGRLIVMVDELNKYAPTGSAETYVVQALKEIAARGRYLGLTLFGAQQFRSRVDKEIIGNAATHAFGHIEAEELAQPGYSYFSPAIKEKLSSLEQGEVLLKHPHFAQPIFLRFPRPYCLKGSDGMRRFPRREGKPIYDQVLDEIKRLGAPYNAAKDELDSRSKEQDNMVQLLRQLRKLRNGDEVLPAIRSVKKAVISAPLRDTRMIIDDEDPFVTN